jgi:ABC-type transport system substrate-binding protein
MMTHIIQNPAFWLNPEKGELGEYSKNYLYDVAEAKKLTAAAGNSDAIEIPYYVSGTGQLSEPEALVHDSLGKSGVFKVDRRQVSANEYRITINVDGLFEGIQSQNSGSQNDLDYVMFRNYHSGRVGGVPFPDAKIDQLAEAQRKEADPQKRYAIAKEIQIYLAQKFFSNPGRSLYTTFSVRWPWLHNSTYANNTGSYESIGQFPELGGHLHWLDEAMPRRNTAI